MEDDPYRSPEFAGTTSGSDQREVSWLGLGIGAIALTAPPTLLHFHPSHQFDGPLLNLLFYFTYFVCPPLACFCGFWGQGAKEHLVGVLIFTLAIIEMLQVVIGLLVWWIIPMNVEAL